MATERIFEAVSATRAQGQGIPGICGEGSGGIGCKVDSVGSRGGSRDNYFFQDVERQNTLWLRLLTYFQSNLIYFSSDLLSIYFWMNSVPAWWIPFTQPIRKA